MPFFLTDNVVDVINITSSTYNSTVADSIYYVNSMYDKYLLDPNSQIFRIISNDLNGNMMLSNYNTGVIPTNGLSVLLKRGTSDFDDYMIQEVIDIYSNSLINKNFQIIDPATRFPLNLTDYTSTVLITKYLSDQENFTFAPTVSYSKNSDLTQLDPLLFSSSQIVWEIIYENVNKPLYQLPSTKWSIVGVVDFNNEMSSVIDSNIIPIQYEGDLTIINKIGGIFNLEIPQKWFDKNNNIVRTSFLIPGVYLIEFKFTSLTNIYRVRLKLNVIQSQGTYT